MIKAHGPSNPEAFFIADHPVTRDFDTGYALSGPSGELLRRMCSEQGLYLESFWRSCLIKEELPKEDDKNKTKTNMLISQYGPLLINEINEYKPNLLIPLGEQSFHFLTNLNNIRKFRGSVLPPSGQFIIEKPNTKVLPILGPYPYLNEEYRMRYVSRIDFGKIRKNLGNNPIPDNTFNIWIARNAGDLRNFFERSYQKTLREGGYVVFDIETYLQIPICISFCFDGFESVCVPIVDLSIDRDNRALMLQMIVKLLKSPIKKVNQNIKFDWRILERWGFEVNNIIGDTMLASSTLYCEFPKNLGFLTSIYTDIPYFKDEGKFITPASKYRDKYYLYNAKDSLATSQIYKLQKEELGELGTQYVYDQLMKIMPIYKRAEDRGIRIDKKRQDYLFYNMIAC